MVRQRKIQILPAAAALIFLSMQSAVDLGGQLFVLAPRILPPVLAARGGESVNVTVLHQVTEGFGQCDLYLSDNAAKFVARNGDMVVATSAPSWDIVIYSRQKNQGYVVKGSEAGNGMLGVLGSSTKFELGKIGRCHDAALGIDCVCVLAKPDAGSRSARDLVIFQDRSQRQIVDATFEIGKPCSFRPEIQRYLGYVFSLRKLNGVPLQLKTRFTNGSYTYTYRTTSIAHSRMPASFFKMPSGFKMARSRVDVMVSQDARETMEALWGSGKD